jgi:hypothetical protein
VIRAIGYLISEAFWTLVFKIAPPQDAWPDVDDPDIDADVAARTNWIREHRPPSSGGWR